jgi:carbon storage regulator
LWCPRIGTRLVWSGERKAKRRFSIKEVTMLVLSRKTNEKIVIDGEIIVTVVKIDRNQVRIGIEAPGHIPVFREEILLCARAESELMARG